MLRPLALTLLLANGLYFAWSGGLLAGYGFAPAQVGEPQRMGQQVAPEVLKVLSPTEFQKVEEQVKEDQAPKECLTAGPLDATQSAAVRTVLNQALPPDSWTLNDTSTTARWIVYMGKYPSNDILAKKRAEVTAMNLKIESLNNATLEPGFSLGGFDTKADADAALTRLGTKGLHTARVVQERQASTAFTLKLPAVGPALAPKLADVRTALGSTSLHSCN